MTDVILLSLAALLLVSIVLKHLSSMNNQVTRKSGNTGNTGSTLLRDLYEKRRALLLKIQFIEDEIIYTNAKKDSNTALDFDTLVQKRKFLIREVDKIDKQIEFITKRMKV